MPASRPDARASFLGAALLACATLAVFSAALDPGRVFYWRDIHAYWLPQVESLARCLREGRWPVWNPWFAFGAPMLADPSYQVFYPATTLHLLLPPAAAFKLLASAHAFWAGLGVLLLARRLGLSAAAGTLAGALYLCSGPFLSTLAMTQHYAGAAFLPWILLALESLLASPSARGAAWLGLAGALQVLAGSGDMALIAALLALGRLVAFGLERPDRRLAQAVGFALVAGALAALLSAAQWLPTLAIVGGAGREAMGEAGRLYWSLHPLQLPDLFVPRLVSDLPLAAGARAALFESREPFLVSLYLGAAALPLVALALAGGGCAPRLPGLALAAFVLLALGRFTALYPPLSALPPLSVLRYPVKYMVPAALAFALLAGLGAERWLAGEALPGRRRAVALGAPLLLAVGAPALLAALRWPALWSDALAAGASLAPAAAALTHAAVVASLGALLLAWRLSGGAPGPSLVALAVLIGADILPAARSVNALAPAALLGHRPPVLRALAAEAGEHRLYVVPYSQAWLGGALARGPAGWDAEARFALGMQERLAAPIAARFGLFGSYDGDFTGLSPIELSELSRAVSQYQRSPATVRLLQLASVGFVLSLEEDSFGGLPAAAPPLESVYARPLRLLRVPEPLPRAYVVSGARVVRGPAAQGLLAGPGFDPRAEVLLEEGAPRPPLPGFVGGARIAARSADALAVEAELSGPGYLVLVEAWDAGWHARVDGREAPVLRANVLFRAVPLAAGRHRVELAYRPRGLRTGLALSALGALGALALLARGRPAP